MVDPKAIHGQRFLLATAFSLIALLALWSALAPPVSAAEITVQPTETLQNAVDRAQAGDTINVPGSRYDETVLIDKQLKLVGNNTIVTVFDLRGNARIDNTTTGISAPTVLLGHYSAAQSTIQDALTLVSANGTVRVGTGTYSGGVTINKAVSLLGAQAGYIGTRNFPEIESIVESTSPTGTFDVTANGVTIDGFTIRNNPSNPAIRVSGSARDSLIRCNISTGTGTLVLLVNSNNTNIELNTMTGGGSPAIVLGGSNNGVTINKNAITGNTTSGILLGDPAQYGQPANSIDNVRVTSNGLENNVIGIKLEPSAPSVAGTVEISGNDLYGNSSYAVQNLSSVVVNATNNWWGSRNGPNHASNTYYVNSQGDKISGSITFAPWTIDRNSRTSFAPVTVGGSSYGSIQAAIDAPSTANGATVSLAAGVFDENVVLTKPLSVVGALPRGNTIINASKPGARGIGLYLKNVNNATIQHLQIQDAGAGVAPDNMLSQAPMGILVESSDYNTLDDLYLLNNGLYGIRLLNGSDHNVVRNNIIDGYRSGSDFHSLAGISSNGGTSANGYTNQANEFLDNTIRGALYGITLTASLDTSIRNNQIAAQESPFWTAQPDYQYATSMGVRLYVSTRSQVERNTVTAAVGIWVGDLLLTDTQWSVYSDPTANSFKENLITSSDAGIFLRGTKDSRVEGNQISVPASGVAGVLVEDLSGFRGVSSGMVVTSNSLSTGAIALDNETAATVDARDNWWGNRTGPKHPSKNPGGTGSTVSDKVDFSPWLGDGTDTQANVVGFQPNATPKYGLAAKLTFVTQPGGAQAGSPLSTQPVVQALDADNAVAISFTGPVTLTIGANPGAGTLSGTNVANAVSGVASFSGLSIGTSGTGYTLVASAQGLVNATSDAIAITDPPSQPPASGGSGDSGSSGGSGGSGGGGGDSSGGGGSSSPAPTPTPQPLPTPTATPPANEVLEQTPPRGLQTEAPNAGQVTGPKVLANVQPSGQTVLDTGDPAVQVIVPAGSAPGVVQAIYQSVVPSSIPPAQGALKVGNTAFQLEFRDPVTNAKVPTWAEITVTFTEADVAAAGGDAGRVNLAIWDGSNWLPLPGTVNRDARTITVRTRIDATFSLVAAPANTGAMDYSLANGWFFAQANGFGGAGNVGYTVTDADGIPFWTEFQRLGGVQVAGYPVSQRFQWDGFVTQVFQKMVFQWRPDSGSVAYVNVFDDLGRLGFDPWLQARRQTPPAFDSNPDSGLAFPQVVERHVAMLDNNPAIKEFFLSTPDWLNRYGLPVSFESYGDLYVVRAQRAVFQEWKTAVPWASAGQVLVANGGDLAKEAGLWPLTALSPAPAPR